MIGGERSHPARTCSTGQPGQCTGVRTLSGKHGAPSDCGRNSRVSLPNYRIFHAPRNSLVFCLGLKVGDVFCINNPGTCAVVMSCCVSPWTRTLSVMSLSTRCLGCFGRVCFQNPEVHLDNWVSHAFLGQSAAVCSLSLCLPP